MKNVTVFTLLLFGVFTYYSESRNLIVQEYKNIVENTTQHCGFSQSGSIKYLKNTDVSHSYNVTVRKKWQTFSGTIGQRDEIIPMAAGERKTLGCSKSDQSPTTTYTWSVVGETKN